MDFSRKIDLHAFTLADPYRVVIDIPQVTFQLPPKSRRERPRPDQGLSLRAGDAGRLAPGFRSRQAGAHRKGLRRRCRRRRAGAAGARSGRRPTARAFCAGSRSTASRPAPNCPAPTEPQAEGGDPRPLVVLDPGHGGIDTGTKAPGGELEKDIVLDFAQRLRERIEKAGKCRVLMTRDRRHLRAAGRPRAHRAQRRRFAVRLDPRRLRCRAGRAMRRARASTRCRRPRPIPRRRGSPRRRTGPT